MCNCETTDYGNKESPEVVEELQNSDSENDDDSEDDFDGYLDEEEMQQRWMVICWEPSRGEPDRASYIHQKWEVGYSTKCQPSTVTQPLTLQKREKNIRVCSGPYLWSIIGGLR